MDRDGIEPPTRGFSVPYHRLQWQDKNKRGCDLHKVKLLSQCNNCGTPFSVPSL